MANKRIAMKHDKKIALVAHDNKKGELIDGEYDRLVPDYQGYRTRRIARVKATGE